MATLTITRPSPLARLLERLTDRTRTAEVDPLADAFIRAAFTPRARGRGEDQ